MCIVYIEDHIIIRFWITNEEESTATIVVEKNRHSPLFFVLLEC